MKRLLLICAMTVLLCTRVFASFYARNLTNRHQDWYWSTFEMKQLDCEIEVLGLFYQTTIAYEIGLTPNHHRSPAPGTYEIVWDFDLVPDAVISECWIKPAGSSEFIAAEIVDLTTAEKNYRQHSHTQPKLLLRHRYQRQWDGSIMKRFQMTFAPVTLSQIPVIKIRYLLPCLSYYNVRRLTLPLREFNVFRRCLPELTITDHDNPDVKPLRIANISTISDWHKTGNSWYARLSDHSYNDIILGVAPESPDRSYLRIYENGNDSFYQMSLLPPVEADEIKPKNILLAVDLVDNNRGHNRQSLFDHFEKSLLLSATPYDSITMLYSAFTPEIYDTNFVPVSPEHIKNMFVELQKQSTPKLNTLPHLLRQAVKVFNDKGKSGEIWLLTNAYTHSDPAETALEIINQTLDIAENSIAFRIISADMDYWPYYWINNQRYIGNDYLYENLARLSWGSYVKLREYPPYDFLDAMLDCVAPTVTSVETIPDPTGGLSFSRFQLNRGRINFPITRPYYEIGLFDGTEPFFVNYFGMLYGELFAKGITVERQPNDSGWPVVCQYWYDRYVQNLLREPQSFETISYIENVSVEHSLLTPYSGLVVPGPEGVPAFKRLTEEIPTTVKSAPVAETQLPDMETVMVYPNPFNQSTTISAALPPGHSSEKVSIKIYNYLGQKIRHHSESAFSENPAVRFKWDGLDDDGREAASGLYLVSVQSGRFNKNIKMTLIR